MRSPAIGGQFTNPDGVSTSTPDEQHPFTVQDESPDKTYLAFQITTSSFFSPFCSLPICYEQQQQQAEQQKMDFQMIIDKIKYWFNKHRHPEKYWLEKEQGLTRALVATMANAGKPDYIDDEKFEFLKDSLAFSYVLNHNLDVLTTNATKIYAFGISSGVYREVAIKKYILKMATVDELRTYLKMSIVDDSNVGFRQSILNKTIYQKSTLGCHIRKNIY